MNQREPAGGGRYSEVAALKGSTVVLLLMDVRLTLINFVTLNQNHVAENIVPRKNVGR